jgi:hypothetical protein
MPHTRSIRTEAWRGAKLGGKTAAIIMGTIGILVALVSLCTFGYRAVTSKGKALSLVDVVFLGEMLGFLLLVVVLTSLYCALMGALMMAIGAVARKICHRLTPHTVNATHE